MDIAILFALIVVIVLLVVLVCMNIMGGRGASSKDIEAAVRRSSSELRNDMNSAVSGMGTLISDNLTSRLTQLEGRIQTLETGNEQKLEQMRETISKRLSRPRVKHLKRK